MKRILKTLRPGDFFSFLEAPQNVYEFLYLDTYPGSTTVACEKVLPEQWTQCVVGPYTDEVLILTDLEVRNRLGGTMSERKRNAKGKPAADKLLREVDPDSKFGKLLTFIIEESANADDILEDFFLSRHDLMVMLGSIYKFYGIGYSVMGDVVTLTFPGGMKPGDIFEL